MFALTPSGKLTSIYLSKSLLLFYIHFPTPLPGGTKHGIELVTPSRGQFVVNDFIFHFSSTLYLETKHWTGLVAGVASGTLEFCRGGGGRGDEQLGVLQGARDGSDGVCMAPLVA